MECWMDGWAARQWALTQSSSSSSSSSSSKSSSLSFALFFIIMIFFMIGITLLKKILNLESTETFQVINVPNLTSFYNPPPSENNRKCQTLKIDNKPKPKFWSFRQYCLNSGFSRYVQFIHNDLLHCGLFQIFLTKFGRGLRLDMMEAPKVRMRKAINVKMLKSRIFMIWQHDKMGK